MGKQDRVVLLSLGECAIWDGCMERLSKRSTNAEAVRAAAVMVEAMVMASMREALRERHSERGTLRETFQ